MITVTVIRTAVVLILIAAGAAPCFSQANPDLQTYFKEYIGLSDEQIAAIRGGQAIAKNLKSRIPDEVFVFGAIYINAAPESYLKFSRDFERLRKLPGYLAIGEFSSPPQLSDLTIGKDVRGDQDCGSFGAECEEQAPQIGACLGIEAGSRLVAAPFGPIRP